MDANKLYRKNCQIEGQIDEAIAKLRILQEKCKNKHPINEIIQEKDRIEKDLNKYKAQRDIIRKKIYNA